MQALRSSPPKSLGGMNVVRVRDYENSVSLDPSGNSQPLDGPVGDVVILDLATEGNYVAIRPSGTEPKAKFYIFTFTPPRCCTIWTRRKPRRPSESPRFERTSSLRRRGVTSPPLPFVLSEAVLVLSNAVLVLSNAVLVLSNAVLVLSEAVLVLVSRCELLDPVE
ncbi:MAG: hypothetical protein R3C99_15560 [Pirellulaceae bacterium]